MAKKQTKPRKPGRSQRILISVPEDLLEELNAEASEGRTRSGWIVYLLRTHPERPANKKK